MKTETNNRMEALACIIADLKAENMMMTERVLQLTDDYNDVARKLRGMEKRKDEDPSKQTLGEMMQMRDHCDKLERENKELKRFAKKIHSFVTDKNLYMEKGTDCFYCDSSGANVCSTFCLKCKSCLGVIENYGVICAARLLKANISFPSDD